MTFGGRVERIQSARNQLREMPGFLVLATHPRSMREKQLGFVMTWFYGATLHTRGGHYTYRLWVDELLHHLETMIETIVGWHLCWGIESEIRVSERCRKKEFSQPMVFGLWVLHNSCTPNLGGPTLGYAARVSKNQQPSPSALFGMSKFGASWALIHWRSAFIKWHLALTKRPLVP